MKRLAARLAKLQSDRVSPDRCDGTGNTYLVNDPCRFSPSRVPRCRKCGGQHAVVIKEVVVGRGADGELVTVPRPQNAARQH